MGNLDRYRTLGSSLVLTIVMNAVTPHLYWLGLWARKEWVWKYKRHEAVSQDALNSLVKGARWEVSAAHRSPFVARHVGLGGCARIEFA